MCNFDLEAYELSEKKKQVTDYLTSMKSRSEIERIIQNAIRTKKLVVSYPKPEEPIYKLTVKGSDPVKLELSECKVSLYSYNLLNI